MAIAYRFLHDRVQQAAYALIPDSEKESTHLNIGRRLYKNISEEELNNSIFDIVNHFNQALVLITDLKEKELLAELNLQAGRKAKDASANKTALQYFRYGLKFLPDNPWDDYYQLSFDLCREQSECEYLCGNYEAAEALFDLVIEHCKTALEKATVQNIRLVLYDITAKYLESIQIGSETLKTLGLNIPTEQDE